MDEKKEEVVTTEVKGKMSTIKKVVIGLGAAVGLGIVGVLVAKNQDKPVECPMADSNVTPIYSVQESPEE